MAVHKQVFANRELSWLSFNRRVLDEALDEKTPLLERMNFLAITASNLDEFFMVRVGGLQMLVELGIAKKDVSGMTPARQLKDVRALARAMIADQYECHAGGLEPALAREGIVRLHPEAATLEQREHLERIFQEEIFPVVTPIAVESAATLAGLQNLRLHIAVRRGPQTKEGGDRYTVMPMGAMMDRFITAPGGEGHSYIAIEDVVRMFVNYFYPGEQIAEAVPFRVTRNADISVREDKAADFVSLMEAVLDERKEGHCSRLEVSDAASRKLVSFLQFGLGVREADTYRIAGPLALADFSSLCRMEGYDRMRYAPWPPRASADLSPRKSMFDELTEKDVLLCHPYESFDPVLRLIEEAARDPDVLAIKQTLYRTSAESPVIGALIEAARKKKYVTALVEIKARFDEARNIERARELEKAGAQVIYGVRGLKVHSKVCLIVRREAGGIARYVHFGTGNYNERTARLYSDISFMTKDPDLGADAATFFNAVAGYSQPQSLMKLVVAPFGLREKILDLIENEIERHRQGQKGFIRAKMNSLVDPLLIDALCRASQAGVKVELNVRGICCLCPGVKGISDNVRIVSIVDRFLEHSRVFSFRNGGDGKVFISSADWMPRNLDRRVELMVPVENEACREKLLSILDVYFHDNAKARRLLPDGGYAKPSPVRKREEFRAQQALYRRARDAARMSRDRRGAVIEPVFPADTRRERRR